LESIARFAVVFVTVALTAACGSSPPRTTGMEHANDAARAEAKKCEEGKAASCTLMGARFLVGDGVAPSHVRAAEMFQSGCDGGDMKGCVILASMHVYGKVEKPDLRLAATLARKGCEGGEAAGC